MNDLVTILFRFSLYSEANASEYKENLKRKSGRLKTVLHLSFIYFSLLESVLYRSISFFSFIRISIRHSPQKTQCPRI